MKQWKKGRSSCIIWLGILLGISIVIATSIGSADIGPMDSLRYLVKKVPFLGSYIQIKEKKEVYETIIFQVRLPRICMAGLVGCGLSVIGATFQGLFRNALADPHILGVSSGAALGATIAMLFEVSMHVIVLGVTGLFAFLGALGTVFLVYNLARMGGKVPITNILLTGTAISTMMSSIISLLMTFHQDRIDTVYMWTLGSFSAANWSNVLLLLIFVFGGVSIIFLYAKELNAILTGEEVAESLGVDTVATKKILIVVSSLVVAVCVSVSGIIGFVGLIIPHCIRLFVGADYRKILPVSCLAGAIFMIFCDTIARSIVAPSELPVGVVTALFGAPYFVYLLYKRHKEVTN